jgi:hypothetical protein
VVTFHRGHVRSPNIRATFLDAVDPWAFAVGKDGPINSRLIDPDYRNRIAVEELISALNYVNWSVLTSSLPATFS